MITINNVKKILGLNDEKEDELLTILINNAVSYIEVYLNTELPQKLYFVAEELAVAKYRKLGSEGISTEKIDVLSTTYTSSDFNQYKKLLDEYKDGYVKPRKARFI